MKLKRKDLELMMQYLDKEKPELVEVVRDDQTFQSSTGFRFTDADNRECTIKLFSAQHNVTPELTKVMKLYTRLAKTEVKDESGS